MTALLRNTGLGLCLGLAVALFAAPPAFAQAEPPAAAESPAQAETAAPLTVGVAPFEVLGPPGAEVPDIGTLLADRLATRGVDRVVGPAQLGAAAQAKPADDLVVQWASQGDVGIVVAGRTTQLGGALSVDVRLRDGATGASLGAPFVVDVARQDALGGAIDKLADRVIEGARAHLGETPETVAAAEPAETAEPTVAAAPPAAPEPASGVGSLGTLGFENDRPISIDAKELEVIQKGGTRELVFAGDVVVKQDDMRIDSNRLEAYYPKGNSQPERLVATGRVKMRRRDREVSCDHATYLRAKEQIICKGNAQMTEGIDRVNGDVIEFDLERDIVKVKGGARVIFTPEKNGDGGAGE